MRDTDRDLTSVVLVRADGPVKPLADLRGKRVGVRRRRLAAGDADPAARARRGRRRRRDVRPPRRPARQARRSHRRRARRGQGAARRHGRCRVRDRRQPPRVRARGPVRDQRAARPACRPGRTTTATSRCSRTAPAHRREFRRAAARDVVRRSGRASAARPGGPHEVAARPHDGLRAARPRRSRASAGGVIVDLGDLGLDEGAHLLVKRALATGPRHRARHRRPTLAVDLPAWCRAHGHAIERTGDGFAITRGPDRWRGRARRRRRAIEHRRRAGASPRAARSSKPGAPELDLPLATSATCGPTTPRGSTRRRPRRSGIPRRRSRGTRRSLIADEVEDAIVQVMTYLIENETAALLVPVALPRPTPPALSRGRCSCSRSRPPTRRATSRCSRAARACGAASSGCRRRAVRPRSRRCSTSPTSRSPACCSPCSAKGSFLSLLWFLRDHAPDDCTREVARLAAQDEARHVAFGLAHLAPRARRGSVAARSPRRRDRAPSRRAREHRRPQRRGVRRACAARRRWLGARCASPWSRRGGRAGPHDGRRSPSSPEPPRLYPGRSRTPVVAPHAQLHVNHSP